jgi:MOSC domain-containing protein YiiM
LKLNTHITQLFAGGIGVLEQEGHRSGIFKRRIAGRVEVNALGIVGDEHADMRVHGGAEKALHQYCADNYAALKAAFPGAANDLVLGAIGENISASTLSEKNVHIGDTFRIGTVLAQVSQPRSPCWKINHRFSAPEMSTFVANHHITGWYYRVLEAGHLEEGDEITLMERQTERFSIDEFWRVQLSHRPDIADLEAIADIAGLCPEWRHRIQGRATRLA